MMAVVIVIVMIMTAIVIIVVMRIFVTEMLPVRLMAEPEIEHRRAYYDGRRSHHDGRRCIYRRSGFHVSGLRLHIRRRRGDNHRRRHGQRNSNIQPHTGL